jgi:hypothetical protein
MEWPAVARLAEVDGKATPEARTHERPRPVAEEGRQ